MKNKIIILLIKFVIFDKIFRRNMFNCENISVIVQGGINSKETPLCLASIRKFLPGAQIILSTWEGSDVDNLDYDVLVLNNDPGAQVICQIKNKDVYNNVNRQLLSTQEGLKHADRKYAMKLRSDLILSDNRFLEYFDKFKQRSGKYNIFDRKILASTLFSRRYIKYKAMFYTPFHVSDWWFFGLKSDLEKYFLDTKLVEEPYFSNYFDLPKNKNKVSPYGVVNFKMAPEQYFCYEFFNRYFKDIYMEDAADVNEKLVETYENCLADNFIILEYEQSGIYLNKYSYSKNEILSGEQYFGLYNFYEYEKLYQKYCDSEYQLTNKKLIFTDKEFGKDYMRICKHIFTLLNPNKTFLKRAEQLIIGLPVAITIFAFKHFKKLF